MSTSDPSFDSTFGVSSNRTRRIFLANATGLSPAAITHLTCQTKRCDFKAKSASQSAILSSVKSRVDGPRFGLSSGWLIAREDANSAANSAANGDAPRCLQLATGQWCSPNYATWFPVASAAILYASELGREVGRSTKIIFLERTPA